jgi:hypothetical protein
MQAHEELVRIRPKRDASLGAWLVYYQRSAALYAELAEIDRGHHHECLYWAERERERVSAEGVAARIRMEGCKQRCGGMRYEERRMMM